MSDKTFDATMKDLMEVDSASWVSLGSPRPPLRVRIEVADLSTISAAADNVLRVEDELGEWILNFEPESSHAGDAPGKLLVYSSLLERRHNVPVRSVLLLL